MSYMNGRFTPTAPPPDHTAILVQMSGQIGEVRSDVKAIKERQQAIEKKVENLKPTKPTDWITVLIGGSILAAAAAGKITWAEALPSLTKLVGH